MPPYIDFLDPSTTSKSVVIINVHILGFIDKTTSKFRVRPHAHEFVLMLSRKYHLATVSTSRGMTIRSTMFGLYYLLFASEEEDLHHHLTHHGLDSSNTFIIDIDTSDRYADSQLGIVHFTEYVRSNNKDVSLHVNSPTCIFLKAISDKSNIGICINEYNSSKVKK